MTSRVTPEFSAFECGEILAEAYFHCIPVSDDKV